MASPLRRGAAEKRWRGYTRPVRDDPPPSQSDSKAYVAWLLRQGMKGIGHEVPPGGGGAGSGSAGRRPRVSEGSTGTSLNRDEPPVQLGRLGWDPPKLTPGSDLGIELPRVSQTAGGAHQLEQWRAQQLKRIGLVWLFPFLFLVLTAFASALGLGFLVGLGMMAMLATGAVAPGMTLVFLLRSHKASRQIEEMPALPRASLRIGSGSGSGSGAAALRPPAGRGHGGDGEA